MNPDQLPRPGAFHPSSDEDAHDPWQAADNSDASSWLLGYSDMMTLLFACFAVLFAYQKAQYLAVSAQPPKPVVAKVVVQPAVKPQPAKLARNEVPAAPQPAPAPKREAVPEAKAPVSPPEPAVSQTPVTAAPAVASAANVMPSNPAPAAATAAASVGPPLPPLPNNGQGAWVAEAGDTTLAVPPATPTVAAADPGLGDAVEVAKAPGAVRLEISDGLLFDPGSADLKPAARAVLDRVARWLGTQSGAIAVEGHTDDRPIATERYRSNWDLSAARASAVARSLIERGLAPGRLRAIGLADTQPRAENASPEGRARNRRVSLVVEVARREEVNL